MGNLIDRFKNQKIVLVKMRKRDKASDKILQLLEHASEPLETKEIEEVLSETRVKVLYRLNLLRGDGLIKGKAVGSGKGCWIWWSGSWRKQSTEKNTISIKRHNT